MSTTAAETSAEISPELSARAAGLRYSSDAEPGIRRRKRGRGFQYLTADGGTLTDAGQIARIRALAIPPAWTDVWICRVAERPPPGHRSRRARPQAVPLSPALAGGARRDQVPPHARVRRGASADPRAGRRRPRPPRPQPREGAGDGRAPARHDEHPRRQRRVRARERVVRADHDARPARDVTGSHDPLPVPRQGRQDARHRVQRRARSRGSSSAARSCPGQHLFQYIDDDGEPVGRSSPTT